jgi:hypothetical protein
MPQRTNRYTKQEVAIARHFRIFASQQRILLIDALIAFGQCRVTQLEMETGLSRRQVYYQLGVLRRIGYIYSVYHKGRYFVRLGKTWYDTGERVYLQLTNLTDRQTDGGSDSPLRVE